MPVRDGAALYTVVIRPVGSEAATTEKLPFLMTRTPYGANSYNEVSVKVLNQGLAASGYIFVAQDIRGRYKSGGTFRDEPAYRHACLKDRCG